MATKVSTAICFILFRLLLPVTLLAGALVRFNALSFLYLVFLLVTPLLDYPQPKAVCTGIFLKILVGISSLIFTAQVSFQIATAASSSLRDQLTNCSSIERVAREFGFQRVDDIPVGHAVRLIMPDICVFVVAITIFVVCNIIQRRQPAENRDQQPKRESVVKRQRALSCAVIVVREFFVVVALAASSIIIPSVLGSVYLLTGLVLMVLWSCYVSLGTFGHLRILLLMYIGSHILVLYLCQFQFFQEFVNLAGLIPRMLGLTGVVQTNCDHVYEVPLYPGVNWQVFVNPVVLLVLYWVVSFETRAWYSRKGLPASDLKGVEHSKRSRRKRELNPECQVPSGQDLEETGSLVFSGSAYGDDEDDQERLVEELEGNANYNSLTSSVDPEKQGDVAAPRPKKSKRSPVMSFFVYVLKQSYVLTLIVMMAWSIKFHSWMTFVLLLTACLLWMLPNSRRATLVASPVLVLYAVCLLLASYIYNINLPELPTQFGEVTAHEIGLMRFNVAPEDLSIQLVFLAFFFMTLRQFMNERRSAPETDVANAYQLESRKVQQTPSFSVHPPFNTQISEAYDSYTMRVLGHFFWITMCKYWIFLCASLLLLISIQEVVIYRIIYLVFFLLFVATFQVSYNLWRLFMFAFWWVVIVYSIGILIIIYTFQFEKFPSYWQGTTGWSNETLADIGLEKFSTGELFLKLLTPTSFLIIIILQVHYFHKPFMQLTALDRFRRPETPDVCQAPEQSSELSASQTETEVEEDERGTRKEKFTKQFRKWLQTKLPVFTQRFSTFVHFLWRLAEINIFKLVVIIIMFVAVQKEEVSAVAAVYVILIALLLPFLMTRLRRLLTHLILLWTCVVILAKTIYQLRIVSFESWEENCQRLTNTTNGSIPIKNLENAAWLGFRKVENLSMELDKYIKLYILILVVILLESIIRYHQKQHYNGMGRVKPPVGILFPLTQREDADKSLIDCIKFFANYTFYKFGLEICYIMTAVTVSVRLDIFAVIYTVLMVVFMVLRRHTLARLWWIYMVVLAILLPLQYLMALGFPPIACVSYPWHSTDLEMTMLGRWLYLPNLMDTTPTTILMADMLQLLFVCLQWQVFRLEQGAQTRDDYGGGDNDEILQEVEANMKIPVEDFTITASSYLDLCKQAVMQYMLWVTMAVIFIAGIIHRSIFNMGYMIAVFCLMWYGNEFLRRPLRKLLRSWNFLIAYCVFVFFIKSFLQLVGCVYIKLLFQDYCWVLQVLGIGCILTTDDILKDVDIKSCDLRLDTSGLEWDVVCFAFLLFQRRIFCSHYFRHVVDLLEAQSRLASRGAELINRILVQEVTRQKEQEAQILDNIKKKMQALKEHQSELRHDYQEPEEHFQAIRSGDYYLFEEVEPSSFDKDIPVPDSLTFGQDPENPNEDVMGPLQVMNTALEEGKDIAVDKVRRQEEASGKEAPGGATPEAKDKEEESKPASSSWGAFIATVIQSVVAWLINLCNSVSRNYRLVAQKLQAELKIEKENILSSHIQRISTSVELSLVDTSRYQRSCLNLSFSNDESQSIASQEEKRTGITAETGATVGTVTEPDPLVEVTVSPEQRPSKCADVDIGSLSLHELEALEEQRQQEFEKSQPQAFRLLVAIMYVLVSHSELLCYFLMVLDQMVYSSLLSLPLALMIFLWGMLSVPRPSKTFWITVITYTEAVVVTKYLFQFGFFPWNRTLDKIDKNPFFPPRIIGIEQKSYFANVDLALLLALFIHRSILKTYGLWKDSEDISKDMEKAEEKVVSHPSSPVMDLNETALTYQQDLSITESGASVLPLESSLVEEEKPKKEPGRIKKSVVYIFEPFIHFFHKVINSTFSATADVYAPMFMCDFINFFIVVFGYKSFGPQEGTGSADVASYISENRIPTPFLIMLLVQFLLIIIDRALFLRKNVLGKFIYQIFLVILIHIWMFFVLPSVTGRAFYENVAAQLWYFVKCIYFALSAYQIRCGYPTRILGNFLTKKYTLFNMVLFQGFLAIPFLLELRALMDWIWTDSTLALGNWLQMEDIYANIFITKCWRYSEQKYPTPRGVNKKALIKYGVGGLLLFIIILIIWFPLVLYTFAYEGFEENPPKEMSVSLRVGTFQPLFHTNVQKGIRMPDPSEMQMLSDHFAGNERALSFLNNYAIRDVSVISMSGESTAIWGISPPAQEEMIRQLAKGDPLELEFSVTVIRSATTGASAASSITDFFVSTVKNPKALGDIISGASNDSFRVNGLFPRFFQLTANEIKSAASLVDGQQNCGRTNVTMKLEGLRENNVSTMQFWHLEEEIYKSPFTLDPLPSVSISPNLTLITFNDRKAPSILSTLVGYGIIGLYVSFILLIGRFLRMSTTKQYLTIMFRELPQVDSILQLCLDIYLVREMKEFRLEEDLYAKLIFVYRSPETMIKWTRPKPKED